MIKDLSQYLAPGVFLNSDHEEVIAFAKKHTEGLVGDQEQAIALFYAVRDGFKYNPYNINIDMKASDILHKVEAHCVDKACLLSAACRVVGIPARMGFGAVRNHLATSRLEEILQTDVLAFHGYSEIYLNGKWVKATPAFNKELCERFNVEPLPFDGENDCLFQQEDKGKGKFMEYIDDYGAFPDIPVKLFVTTMMEHYGHLFTPEVLTTGTLQVGELKVSFDPNKVKELVMLQSEVN